MAKRKQGKMKIIEKIAQSREYQVQDFTNKKIEQALKKLLIDLKDDMERNKQELEKIFEEINIKEFKKNQAKIFSSYSKEIGKATNSLNNLVEREIASYKKEEIYGDVINNFFDDIISTLTKGEEISIELTKLGTFELKKHLRFGGMYVKFNVSQNIKNKLKEINQKNMSVDHLIDYTKQQSIIKKAYQKSDKYQKGKIKKEEKNEHKTKPK